MDGIRLFHPKLRSVAFRLVESRSISADGNLRKEKTTVLDIDETGHTIISTGVWEEIQKGAQKGSLSNEFFYAGTVKDPPTLIITVGQDDLGQTKPTVISRVDDRIPRLSKPTAVRFKPKPSNKY